MSEVRRVKLTQHERGFTGKVVEVDLVLRQVSSACASGEGHCTSVNPDGSMCACGCHWVSLLLTPFDDGPRGPGC